MPDDISNRSPDSLLAGFSRSPIGLCLIGAVALHVVVIAGSSLSFIRDRWIDPEAAEQRRIEQDGQKQESARVAKSPKTGAVTQPAGRPAGRTGHYPDAAVPDRARGSDIYRATTRAADPSEIPREPDDMTLPLQ